MTEKLFLNDKPDGVIKAEYYELMHRILNIWLNIPPDRPPNPQEELELSILEGVAFGYVKVMKERNIYALEMVVPNG